jgi:serine/threonine-protein kinase
MQITLTVVAGPHTGETFTFTGRDRFLVGRSVRAHFRLRPGSEKDRRVSRTHFMVEVNPPLCCVYDMNSRNGTYVNGKRITTARLNDGDEVRAGHTVLRVAILQPPGEPTTLRYEVFEPAPPAAPAAPPASPRPVAPVRGVPDGTPCAGCAAPQPEGAAAVCVVCRQQAAGREQPIPGFLLLRELGRGGMGVVHLAWSEADGGAVAVKTVLPGGTPRRNVVERFLREASILRELDHPHIVAFREMGAASGLLFFAMDYVPGIDAGRLLQREGRLKVRPAVRLICQALHALEYAHARGFVHRDIKPANLLVESAKGKRALKLADFGLARIYQTSQLSGLTLQNEVGGTIDYMPPEQITDYRNVRPAADQYSAAATLYRLLTGHFVYDPPSKFAAYLDKILWEDPVPIRSRHGDLPKKLAVAIHRALARDPDDRYPDARAFRRALLPFAR